MITDGAPPPPPRLAELASHLEEGFGRGGEEAAQGAAGEELEAQDESSELEAPLERRVL